MSGSVAGWVVEHLSGSAEDLFLGPQSSATLLQLTTVAPAIRVLHVDRPTLVLGSSQSDLVLNSPRTADLNTVRRRSGGGAVWLDPAEQVWIDVVVPVGHDLWHTDVTGSFDWLGKVWARTILDLGVDALSLTVHRGAMCKTAWSDLLCFAGVGPGEVFVRGRKLLGISQRRSRSAALFQCGLLLHWSIDLGLFAEDAIGDLDAEDVQLAGIGLDELVSPTITHVDVERALMERLSGV
jgi:lipoate-protein ligase A